MREPQKTARSSWSFQPWRSILYLLRTEKQQQKSCKDRNLCHRWHHLLQHIAMFVFSSLDSPWEPSLLEQIDMDVRGHNMYERNSFSRFKVKEFTFRVPILFWPNVGQISFQTYNASTALEGIVKHKARLTNSFQAGCQMMPEVSISRDMFLSFPGERHGTQPSISSPSAVDCAEVGCWLLPVSYLDAILVHVTIEWLDFYISLLSIRPRVSKHWSDGSLPCSMFLWGSAPLAAENA